MNFDRRIQAIRILWMVVLTWTMTVRGESPEVLPVRVSRNGVNGIEYRTGDQPLGRWHEGAPAGVRLKFPGRDWEAVRFGSITGDPRVLELGPERIGDLSVRWRLERRTPSLVERTLELTAHSAQRVAIGFPIAMAYAGEYASFSGGLTNAVVCDTVRGAAKTETFPVGMVRGGGKVIGVVADSPGLWENRCQVRIDPVGKELEVLAGDGRDPYPLVIRPPEDARDTYQYEMDGWQVLAAGETRRFTTWVFASEAQDHYDAQVAAHLAVANAKGWNGSTVEAILRNTSLFLLRRNLARDADNRPRDGRYIFVSGPGYGWKQWVTDGFYTALGLDDPEKTIEANRAVFWTRMDYEDNAQYYLIWAVLMKRAGGSVNESLVRQAYRFLREHEKDGLYVPPPLPGAPNAKGWKTYHDVLPYDDDDSPASNQGFHCGALMAAKELGLGVDDREIEKAIAAYRSLFHRERGFMPTSRKQRDTMGQDTLYGATLTYAVFGSKLLTDEMVLTHHRTSEAVKTPYGLRVISQADGALLPGHSGVYCYGGSWFLNDAANYLLAMVHGLPPKEADALLVERIAREIAHTPAFNESISTVDGHPHGHILYSWNSGYRWLRQEIRRRLGQTGPDPVDQAIDTRLGVVRDGGWLRLEPQRATSRVRSSGAQGKGSVGSMPAGSAIANPAPGKPVPVAPDAAGAQPEVGTGALLEWVIENARFRVVISPDGVGTAFIDRASGKDWIREGERWPVATVVREKKTYPVRKVMRSGERVTLTFGEADVTVVLTIQVRPECVVLRVASVQGEVDALTFFQLPLALVGRPEEPFGACVLSLNLPTRVDALPALQRDLRVSAEKKFGIVGAQAAIVGAPMDRMLVALRETLASESELPVCRVAGPWAKDVPFSHGSYLFNFGSLTESNVTEWIETTRRVGFTQIDNHGGGAFFRFGDFELNRKKWPDGWDGYRRIVGRLHEAGIGSIFHTYAFFIDKGSKYVTPVPDPRLDAFRTLTLAEGVGPESTEITVQESTAGMNTVTGFFVHNSVVLQLGRELVTFAGVSQSAPWKFTGVKRGAFGTRPSSHERGEKARHLKECFGLLVPDPESTLFEEIAARHAEIVDQCGFDGIYLDAIDGSSILRGGDEVWYWANKFVVEIQKRLKRPVGMEMSAMWHHFWQYRTRWQAWDLPQRGHLRFVDLHASEVNGGLMLPLHLGWWGFQTFDPPQIEPSYPEVIETLGARLIGWDAGISLTASTDREALRKTPLFQRAAETLRICEDLRHAGAFDAVTRARLRDPRQGYGLFKAADGRHRFRPTDALSSRSASDEPWSRAWRVTNRFGAQPLRFRLENLAAVHATDVDRRVWLADFSREPADRWKATTAAGVTSTLEKASSAIGTLDSVLSGPMTYLRATHAGRVPRTAAWAKWEKRVATPLAAKDGKSLVLEVDGDGSGALLAIRLESPMHTSYGAVADRYVPIDFTGRRRLTLVETESARWSDYVWNDGKHAYNVYRETIDFGAIETVSVWLQNLPEGRETRVGVGPIAAMPLRSEMLRRPRLAIAGQWIEFPVEVPSGGWIEGEGPGACGVFNARGERIQNVEPVGAWPMLREGVNSVELDPGREGEGPTRARLTVFSQGEPI